MNPNATSFGEIRSMQVDAYVEASMLAMRARFSNFVITPEQVSAWEVGFRWIFQIGQDLDANVDKWLIFPEFVAPLISGRPDIVIVTNTHLLIVEMKTGELHRREGDKRQTLGYAADIWGKLKASRGKVILPVLLSKAGSDKATHSLNEFGIDTAPGTLLSLTPVGLKVLLSEISLTENGESSSLDSFRRELLYSPRPSVVEAATSLVAKLEDQNVTTGLSGSEEIDRIIRSLLELAKDAQEASGRIVAIVTGSPGAGKTLVGLRLAHDPSLQSALNSSLGTPLYLTGNATLVEVLVESLARDEHRRAGTSLFESRKNSNAKVKLVHGVVGSDLGIESNVVVFDEGQRVWTAEHMQAKKGNKNLESEATEILKALSNHPWVLLVVLIGEGQEINTGEEGVDTWLKAVYKANFESPKPWHLFAPPLESAHRQIDLVTTSDAFQLKTTVRTDNAANVSEWVRRVLDRDQKGAIEIREQMQGFPLLICRDLDVAKSWIKSKSSKNGGTSGLLASSKSKRLIHYGVDVASDANRNINWGSWYLDTLPNLNSSEALEIAATEFKCQGLELDWSLMCWSWDMSSSEDFWIPQTLDASKGRWNQIRNESKIRFQFNAYRVLLTRSRKGMVIWIPLGDDSNSMPTGEMDAVANFLMACGATPLKVLD
jgi:hypothetical protein